MSEPPQNITAINVFVQQIEKALRARHLYDPSSSTHRTAADDLFEKFTQATSDSDFTLKVTATSLVLDKKELLTRDDRQESFFFPFYRDGLRELTFGSDTTRDDLEQLLQQFEAEMSGDRDPTQDAVSSLWRCELTGIRFQAIDGIGSDEGDDGSPSDSSEDYATLVNNLLGKIENPAATDETGQSYSIRIDADTSIGATDMLYEATTAHRAFEDNPTVLQLTREEAETLTVHVKAEDDAELLARFEEVLLVILMDPAGHVTAQSLRPVFAQLLQASWADDDHRHTLSLLDRLQSASSSAPLPENRASASEIISAFLSEERLRLASPRIESGELELEVALRLWDLAGATAWQPVVELAAILDKGDALDAVVRWLRHLSTTEPGLLQQTFRDETPTNVRVALAVLTPDRVPQFETDLIELTQNDDPSLRLKAVAALGPVDAAAPREALWRVLEREPEKSIRLLAFQFLAEAHTLDSADRLHAIISRDDFDQRPSWEQEKYARLLGLELGADAIAFFEARLPNKRWLWQVKLYVRTHVAMCGIDACGERGWSVLKTLAKGGGKLGDAALRVLCGEALEFQTYGGFTRPVAVVGKPTRGTGTTTGRPTRPSRRPRAKPVAPPNGIAPPPVQDPELTRPNAAPPRPAAAPPTPAAPSCPLQAPADPTADLSASDFMDAIADDLGDDAAPPHPKQERSE